MATDQPPPPDAGLGQDSRSVDTDMDPTSARNPRSRLGDFLYDEMPEYELTQRNDPEVG